MEGMKYVSKRDGRKKGRKSQRNKKQIRFGNLFCKKDISRDMSAHKGAIPYTGPYPSHG